MFDLRTSPFRPKFEASETNQTPGILGVRSLDPSVACVPPQNSRNDATN